MVGHMTTAACRSILNWGVQPREGAMAATLVTTVNVRYMVDDVDAAVAWYTKHLGFKLLTNAAPAFADVTLGSLRLLLSGPKSSAGRPMPDGARPGPGGSQILLQDPCGNLVELFQPARH